LIKEREMEAPSGTPFEAVRERTIRMGQRPRGIRRAVDDGTWYTGKVLKSRWRSPTPGAASRGGRIAGACAPTIKGKAAGSLVLRHQRARGMPRLRQRPDEGRSLALRTNEWKEESEVVVGAAGANVSRRRRRWCRSTNDRKDLLATAGPSLVYSTRGRR